MIKNFTLEQTDGSSLQIRARVCCQNPSLNPMQLASAVEAYLPDSVPDHVRCERTELYDTNEVIFR